MPHNRVVQVVNDRVQFGPLEVVPPDEEDEPVVLEPRPSPDPMEMIQDIPREISLIHVENLIALASGIYWTLTSAKEGDILVRARAYHAAATMTRELHRRLTPFETWNP
jgi:hypothetical protein